MDLEEMLQTALMKHRDGDVVGAARIYGQILEQDPTNATASLNLASIALGQNQIEEARGMLRTVLAHDEDNGIAHLLYSRVCFMQGNHDEGYSHINAAFEQLPDEEGVAAEFVSAMRRRYFTFSRDDYLELFDAAQAGKLAEDRLQRLAHLTFLRISRPELIRMLVEPALPADTPDALTRWLQQLEGEPQSELALLARNFVQAVELMRGGPRYAPQRATLSLRVLEGEQGPDTRECETLEDADSLTSATLELVRNGELQFIPFSTIQSVEFAQPAPATGVLIELRDGQTISGLMPLFYLFTEFSESEMVRQGRSSLVRPIIGDIASGVGLRVLRVDGEPMPIVRIDRIEFEP
jgi:tetratricopeptide (TPR) repeat protein